MKPLPQSIRPAPILAGARPTAARDVPGVPRAVRRTLESDVVWLGARLCLVSPFVVAGLYKLLNWQGGLAEMAHAGLHPTWLFNIAALVTELVGSILVILNRQLWLGAGALGIFTVLTTFIAHRFWELPEPARTMQLNDFCAHAALSAAFILVALVSFARRRAAAWPL